jgi:dolichol kinase
MVRRSVSILLKGISAENYVWLGFCLFGALYVQTDLEYTGLEYTGLAIFLVKLANDIVLDDKKPSPRDVWRNIGTTDQGQCSAAALVPIILESMGLDPFISAITTMFDESHVLAVVSLVATAVAPDVVPWKSLILISAVIVLFNSIHVIPALHSVFTKGEWKIVCILASVALTEFLFKIWMGSGATVDHHFVAQAGLIGCTLGCAAIGLLGLPLSLSLPLLVITPLVVVELSLWHIIASDTIGTPGTNLSFPRALSWLVDFLSQTETPLMSGIPSLPRAYWLRYWAFILLLSLPMSPTACNSIIARKWFHLIAILLFAPVTLAAPQLLSLSYAIALAVLMVLECIRHRFAWLDAFYQRYMDTAKDQKGKVIVSHFALLFGCAAPLWIQESIGGSNAFLALWGILSLGVGDSMGALIGSKYGRLSWGTTNNQRTVEGSLAMCLSMSLLCWLSEVPVDVWFPPVLFTTLLEAFTLQIDNIVIPLAGVAVILLCEQVSE